MKPGDAVGQEILHLGVEAELVLARQGAVEPVDREVQLQQTISVASQRIGLGDGGGVGAGLVHQPRRQGRAAAIDDDVRERGRDDLATQPMALDGVREPLLQRLRKIALQFAVEIQIVGNVAREDLVVEPEFGVGEQHRPFGPRQALVAALPLGERRIVGQELHRPVEPAARLQRRHCADREGPSHPVHDAARARVPASAARCCAARAPRPPPSSRPTAHCGPRHPTGRRARGSSARS